MQKVLIEKCLNNVPNKFELSILVMNRAKEILLGAKTDIETTRFTKKSINKALKEVEENKLDIKEMEEKIKTNLLTDNLFLKDTTKYDEETSSDDLDNADFDYENIDDLDDSDGEFEDDLDDDLDDNMDEDEK